jgi:hypothetical protein
VSYLEEAADILRKALESAEERYRLNMRHAPEDRRELLEVRVRVAEGFARLHEAESASRGPDAGQETGQ